METPINFVTRGMTCPVCRIELRMTERQGVEVDYCPQCRGVWLDRGELDKIIERSTATALPAAPLSDAYREPERDDRRYHSDERHYESRDYDKRDPKRRRKPRNFLEDLFDFD